MFNKVGVFYVQPCCTYITTEITDMILKRGDFVKFINLFKKILNKLYNLFAKNGYVFKKKY